MVLICEEWKVEAFAPDDVTMRACGMRVSATNVARAASKSQPNCGQKKKDGGTYLRSSLLAARASRVPAEHQLGPCCDVAVVTQPRPAITALRWL